MSNMLVKARTILNADFRATKFLAVTNTWLFYFKIQGPIFYYFTHSQLILYLLMRPYVALINVKCSAC